MKHEMETIYKHSYTFSEDELEEVILNAWVAGWIETDHSNDAEKKGYAKHVLSQLRETPKIKKVR